MRRTILFSLRIIFLTLSATNVSAQQATVSTQALNSQQQSMVIISALTATGDTTSLKDAVRVGLDRGLTINEIKEIMVQLYAYCGFPRSLNAISIFMQVLDERKSRGIQDKEGKEIRLNEVADGKYEQGRLVLEKLSGTPQPKPAPGFGTFAPKIDVFLKEHLFADIFASDVLTYHQRELVTIAALTSMEGVEAQLQSHLRFAKNIDVPTSHLEGIADLVGQHISNTQANSLRKFIDKPAVPVIDPGMMVRIAEIEIVPEFLEQYLAILKEEAAASVKIEPGVISILPMYEQKNPHQIRLLEIYATRAAYEAHLKTPHFQHYKTATLKMVKSLKLVEMKSIDEQMMPLMLRKLY